MLKTLFLGGLAARVAPRILGKMTEKLDTNVLAELTDMQRLIPALADAEIVVGHIWRSDFPEAPRLKLLQAATAGVDMIDLPSLPRGITLCNVFGHEPAIAEYVLMTMLAMTHRLVDTVTAFRGGSWAAHQPAGASPRGDRRRGGAFQCLERQPARRRRARCVVAALEPGTSRPAPVAVPVPRAVERADDAALLRVYRGYRRPALGRSRRQSRPLCPRRAVAQCRDEDLITRGISRSNTAVPAKAGTHSSAPEPAEM